MKGFSFTTLETDNTSQARTGVITTPHGDIHTPAFVPVGTQASVKSLTPEDLSQLGVELFFVNTYHTYLRPNLTVIDSFGGLHRFMGWNGPIITDSGGFQVFSLAKPAYKSDKFSRDEEGGSLVTITEEGVRFRSHWDGSMHLFTPESSMQYQWTLASDIHIAFDECTSYPATHEYAEAAMERTHRWLDRSIAEHAKLSAQKKPYQALYGVIQGGVYPDLRVRSTKVVIEKDTDGIAIGGVSVGENKQEMRDVLATVCPLLPAEKPRHLLGVGEIDDIFALVESGVDTFDCVQPTRLARMGKLYCGTSSIDITLSTFALDQRPVDPACSCYTCTHFSRSYVHHLFRVRELLGYRLATIHNISYINTIVSDIRRGIASHTLGDVKKHWLPDAA